MRAAFQWKQGIIFRSIGVFFCVSFVLGCARSKIKDPHQALRISSKPPIFKDDLGKEHLKVSIESIVDFYKERPDATLSFGPHKVSRLEYIKELQKVLSFMDSGATLEETQLYISKYFFSMEVYGNKAWGDAFMTSYYEPVVKACKKKRTKKKCTDPLYGLPKDFVSIDMREYFKEFESLEAAKKAFLRKSRSLNVAGRIVEDENKKKRIVPYYSREEHYRGAVSAKENKPIAFLDPIDHFFLQIQGSGTLDFGKKQVRVGYAGQNGHPYVAIGRFLKDVIPIEEMSLRKIEDHLRTLSEKELFDLLAKNPSYVYFTDLEGAPVTYSGSEVIEGRTIATDPMYFPKGVMGYLQFEKPVLNDKGEAMDWVPSSRFVFDQDTGGAIRGPGRLDLFWGKGAEAARYAGVMRHDVRLYYLLPKRLASPLKK